MGVPTNVMSTVGRSACPPFFNTVYNIITYTKKYKILQDFSFPLPFVSNHLVVFLCLFEVSYLKV